MGRPSGLHDGARWIGISFACACVAVAALLRWFADPYLPPGFPFLTFFPAVILTAFLFGLWPGILSAALATGAAWLLFMPDTPGGVAGTTVALLFFVSVTAVDIAIIHVMQRAQERLRDERTRSARLAEENSTLLLEAQHRISNNLQMLSSLLNLQGSGQRDDTVRQALSEAANRVKLIGKIQRDLYGRSRGETAALIGDLARDTVRASGGRHVSLAVDLDEAVTLSPATVTPVALVVMELVANAIEHGGSDRPLRVALTMRREDTEVVLAVADDGVGLPPGFDPRASRSLGLRLVHGLTDQVGGRIEFHSADGGTTATLRIPITAA